MALASSLLQQLKWVAIAEPPRQLHHCSMEETLQIGELLAGGCPADKGSDEWRQYREANMSSMKETRRVSSAAAATTAAFVFSCSNLEFDGSVTTTATRPPSSSAPESPHKTT